MRVPTPGAVSTRLLAVLAAVVAHAAHTYEARAQQAPIRVTWLGHAGFEVVSPGGTRLLIDPWIGENPATPAVFRDSARYAAPATRPAAILATHAHGDHDADVARLARVSGAMVVASGDHLEALKIPDGHYLPINVGGAQRVGDVEVRAVPAVHSVSPGHALGYVLRFADGRSLYHSGDTWVFGDMALVEQLYHPAIVLLASGGGRGGEDPATAALAARTYFPSARAVVPMHWGALPPPFATEAEVRRAFAGEPRLRMPAPGAEMRFSDGANSASVADSAPAHDTFTIESRALGETRTVHVHTPAGFGTGGARLPVLYMPDGGLDEDFPHVVTTVDSLIALGRIRPVIVVGIPNTQRRRDLTGPTRVRSDSAVAPRVGGSAAFRRFIREELMPAVERRYRTTRERGIVGESFAGLFVVETFLKDPSLFTHYVAFDPSLWWNRGALADASERRPPAAGLAGRTLFLASSKDDLDDRTAQLAAALRAASPRGLAWTYAPRPDLTHATIFRGAGPAALANALR